MKAATANSIAATGVLEAQLITMTVVSTNPPSATQRPRAPSRY